MSLCLRIPKLGLNFDSEDEEEADEEDDEEDDEEEELLIITMLFTPTIQYGEVARTMRLMSSEGLCTFRSLLTLNYVADVL
jgi:hypothetical protein